MSRMSRWPVPKVPLLIIGLLLILLGLLADILGLGRPGSLGIGQILVLSAGLGLALIAFLGRKVFTLYKSVAVLLLNTLVLLAALEILSITVARVGVLSLGSSIFEDYQSVPYYKKHGWAPRLWQEASSAENYQYRPYVIWGHKPFDGKLVTVTKDGTRLTPGADCRSDALEIYAFGGSTLWGWGSPNWGTIPAYLQEDLDILATEPLCITNWAEDGYVSTQSLIVLMRLLQSGETPDLVIFYDGVNDVYAAYEAGKAGLHPAFDAIAERLEEREHSLVKWFKEWRLYSVTGTLAERLLKKVSEPEVVPPADLSADPETIALADAVTEVYLNNYKIVSALSQEYGFDFLFFWQPHLGVDKKKLTTNENLIKLTMEPELIGLAKTVYARLESLASEYQHLKYIADVFQDQEQQIWIDTWGHVTPEGNGLIAQRMLDFIEEVAVKESPRAQESGHQVLERGVK